MVQLKVSRPELIGILIGIVAAAGMTGVIVLFNIWPALTQPPLILSKDEVAAAKSGLVRPSPTSARAAPTPPLPQVASPTQAPPSALIEAAPNASPIAQAPSVLPAQPTSAPAQPAETAPPDASSAQPAAPSTSAPPQPPPSAASAAPASVTPAAPAPASPKIVTVPPPTSPPSPAQSTVPVPAKPPGPAAVLHQQAKTGVASALPAPLAAPVKPHDAQETAQKSAHPAQGVTAGIKPIPSAQPAPPSASAPSSPPASQSTAPSKSASQAPTNDTSQAAPAAQASSASADAAANPAPLRVVINYESAAPGLSDVANELAAALRAKGIAHVETSGLGFIVSANQVKYFHDADKAGALRVKSLVTGAKDPEGKPRSFQVNDFTQAKSPPEAGHIEIWLRSW